MCKVCGDLSHATGKSRRGFLRAGAFATLAPWGLDLAVAADPPKPGATPPQNAIAPAEALKRLVDGNARYAANTPSERDFSAGRAARAQGQAPIEAILGCADSRIAPELAGPHRRTGCAGRSAGQSTTSAVVAPTLGL